MKRETQFCTFRVGEHLCGIAVLDVREILMQRELTPVPLAPPSVKGLMNLRGGVVPAIDLRMRLGQPQHDDGEATHVIVRTDDETTSLMVDAVEDVITVTDDSFEAPPQSLTGLERDCITGVHKLDGRLLLILDARRIVQPEES
ncbi:MAG: chemotaxis protein CheW [Clostridia bacterium]|nr:chemotaxis protein CheW [Deltaproteobacteria bacterium]